MIYRFGEFELDDVMFQLSRHGKTVAVETRVLDLLIHLVRNRDRVVSRSELQRVLWPDVTVDEKHGLDQAVYTARRSLNDDAKAPKFIQTIRRRGLRFVCSVREYRSTARPAGNMPYVGREGALQVLREVLFRAARSHGALALVSGEPGIGKSSLLDRAALLADELEMACIQTKCLAVKGVPDLWPWMQVIQRIQAAGEPTSSGSVSHVRAISDSRLASSPEADRFALFEAIHQFLAHSATKRPVVLLIDDLHVADPTSMRLLFYLAHSLPREPIAIVATSRPRVEVGDAETRQLLSHISATAHTALTLDGLRSSDVETIVSAFVETGAVQEAARVLTKKTGGNPFFISQLLSSLDSDSGELPAELPATLVEAVRSRLHRLGCDTRRVLGAASVLGEAFSVQDLLATVGLPAGRVLEALDEARAAGLVRESAVSEEAEFAHAILRDTLYKDLDMATRAGLHLRAAEALSGRPNNPLSCSQAAVHFRAALPLAGKHRAFLASQAAARFAMRRRAFGEAAVHLRSCLDLAPQNESLTALRLDLGEALIRSGRRSQGRSEVLAAVEGSDGGLDIAQAALRISPGFFAIEAGVVDPFAKRLLRAALGREGLLGRKELALVRARLAMALYWEHGSRETVGELAALALESLPTLVDDEAVAWVLAYAAAAQWSPDSLEARLDLLSVMPDLREGSVEPRLMALVFSVASLVETGEFDVAERRLEELASFAERACIPQSQWYVPLLRGMFAIERGRFDEAVVLAERMAASGARAEDSNAVQCFGAMRAMCEFHRGPTVELARQLGQLVDRYPAIPAWESAAALILWRAGARRESEELYVRLLESIRHVSKDLNWLIFMAQLGELCADIGDAAGASVLARELGEYSNRRAIVGYGVVTWGSIARILGRLEACRGRYDAAVEHLVRAIGDDRRARSWAWLPYSYLALAELEASRAARSSRDRGRGLARRALALGMRQKQKWIVSCGERLIQ